MKGVDKLKALRTVTMVNENDVLAQSKIDTLENINAKYFILYSAGALNIGHNCIVFD